MLDLTCFPNIQRDGAGAMWQYGTKAASLSQDFRVKTPASPAAAIVPAADTGYTTYSAGQYTANSGFATMKVVTRFVQNDYPVYDVYVKLPEAGDFILVAENKSFATTGHGSATLDPSDYDNGFAYFYIELLTGYYTDSLQASNVLDAAIDNIMIYAYDPAEHVIAPTAEPTTEPTAAPTATPIKPSIDMGTAHKAANNANAFYYVINLNLNNGTVSQFTVVYYPEEHADDPAPPQEFDISNISGAALKFVSVLKGIPAGSEDRRITAKVTVPYTFGTDPGGTEEATQTTSFNDALSNAQN